MIKSLRKFTLLTSSHTAKSENPAEWLSLKRPQTSVSYRYVSQRTRKNTAACVSLSNSYNVKDREAKTLPNTQAAVIPPGATTISRYRRERRLYRFIFPCQEFLFKKDFLFRGHLRKPFGLISGAALITAQFPASSKSFEKVFQRFVRCRPLGLASLPPRREWRF